MAENAKIVRSEDLLGQKWDHCISNTLIKFGAGLGLGVVFSFFLFKRKPWPVAFGGGFGLGAGYSNCQHSFSDPFNIRATVVKVLPKQEEESKPESTSSSPSAQSVQSES